MLEPRRRKKSFNLHRFILRSKLIAVEILSAVVFFMWLFRVFLEKCARTELSPESPSYPQIYPQLCLTFPQDVHTRNVDKSSSESPKQPFFACR